MQSQPEDERLKYESVWGHEAYRRSSPGLHALQSTTVIDFFCKQGVMSILDAGCGAGLSMEWLITNHPGKFRVHGFDIASNCLNPFFAGRESEVLSTGCLWVEEDIPQGFDAVYCTDVMEHIPPEHIHAVLSNLCRAAGKAAFLGIALFDDKFGPLVMGAPLHLTVRPVEWWVEQIEKAGFKIDHQSINAAEDGTPLWLYVMAICG